MRALPSALTATAHTNLDMAVAGRSSRSAAGAIGAMLVLAGLDLVGAVLARHWADQRALVSLIGGMTVFALLFWVYGKSLDYAELSTITVGWVGLLQIGVIVIQRVDGGTAIPPHKLGVIGAILLLQAVLILT